LRLYGPTPFFARKLHVPLRIAGRELPAGATVAASQYVLHRNPKVWPDPERFDPERFLQRKPKPYEYVPFGGGQRTCLGMSFALFEVKVVVASILQRATLRPAFSSPPQLKHRGIVLAPSHPVPMIPIEVRPRVVGFSPGAGRRPQAG